VATAPTTPPTAGTTGTASAPATTAPATTPAPPPAAIPTTTPGAPAATGKHAKPYSPTDEELAAADEATRTHAYSVTETGEPSVITGKANKADKSDTSTPVKPVTPAAPSNPTPPATYTVGTGDSLSGIAVTHHLDGGWQRLYQANHQLIGDDPNLIKPGQILNLR
jgi:LysM repeat protein